MDLRNLACRRPLAAMAAAALAAALAACTSSGGGTALIQSATSADRADSSGVKTRKVYTAADFAPDVYCPPLQLRTGTESLPIYERGHDGEQDFVRYQAAINKTARQCAMSGDTLTIKIGVEGRVVAGPKGGAGTIPLPLRIAIVKQMGGGKGPLYSKLFKLPVTVSGPTFGADFSQVIENVSVKIGPDDRDLIVYVGFDDGKKSPAPSG
jgi:hypothetical protein